MPYKQRDVVFVEMPLPTGEVERHPFLIISCRAASNMEKDNYHTAIMMTGSKQKDKFSFPVEDSMFEGPLKKQNCQLRLYIIVSFPESKVQELLTRMKPVHFKAVLQQIKEYVLVIDT